MAIDNDDGSSYYKITENFEVYGGHKSNFGGHNKLRSGAVIPVRSLLTSKRANLGMYTHQYDIPSNFSFLHSDDVGADRSIRRCNKRACVAVSTHKTKEISPTATVRAISPLARLCPACDD